LISIPDGGRPLLLASLASLLGALGFTDDHPGEGLYAFDNQSRTVLVWRDADTVYQAAKDGHDAPRPDRTLKGSMLRDISLGWGGLAMDDNRNKLYLVSENGKVSVIHSPSTRNGELSGTSQITTFNLGASGDRYGSGSVFGQAANGGRGGDILYLWKAPNEGGACVKARMPDAGDIRGVALAAN